MRNLFKLVVSWSPVPFGKISYLGHCSAANRSVFKETASVELFIFAVEPKVANYCATD